MKNYWTLEKTNSLFDKPFLELIFEAQNIHRKYFNPLQMQISTLLSIKTGGCPEDCKYCPQSARYQKKMQKNDTNLLDMQTIIKAAEKAKLSGADRFCMGAAWKHPKKKDMPFLIKIIKKIKQMGLETCMTLGSLDKDQSEQLAKAGLDFYNHNLDTSPNFYKKIITTRTYQDRLNTLNQVRNAGIKVCSGGILGLGETVTDRKELLMQLANLNQHPESVPINMLVKTPGMPLEDTEEINTFDFIKTIAAARIMMPKSYIRLSAGRNKLTAEAQVMCFMAGVNSVFYGCKLLTTKNVEESEDRELFKKVGIITNHNINKNLINKTINKNYHSQHYDATQNNI
ncbi:Biotin synthase [Buchnera aphidicola (Thelaxes suberi)]|uniref:biotin synthase BioB n=1 Tax=Buchnera aphidicola TaxID=9 RepID=UPI003A6887E3